MAENIVNVKKKHKVHASVYVVSELSRVGKVQHKLVFIRDAMETDIHSGGG